MRRFTAFFLCFCFLWVPVRAAAQEKLVALTFDDGPSGRFTRRLLEGLAQRDVRATFFLCGYRLEQYPRLAESIAAAGHELGVHGFSHQSMCTMTARELTQEIRSTLSLLPSANIAFLRPPGGMCSQRLQTVAEKFDLTILQWSVDPQDWAIDNAAQIAQRVIQKAGDGDVILLHDMSDSSVDAALMIVDALLAKGFRFVTASELAQAKGRALIPGKVYARFRRDGQDEK